MASIFQSQRGGEAAPVSDDERRLRVDLAACYRLVAMFGWDDLVSTHISARLPGEDAFLINPFGMLFEEITASSLVKIDHDGNILGDSPYPVNRAGFVIHGAIHEARPEAGCVIHLHTTDGAAVSALAEGLLPLNQSAMLVTGSLAYHDYEGVAVDIEERARLKADLGAANAMILRNHGTLALGRTVAEAFLTIYYLEWACATQVRTLAMGRPPHPAHGDAVGRTEAMGGDVGPLANRLVWPAVLRRLARQNPGWED